ncbi:hypothetical protein EJV47_11550 [Hymenobacter gummosus]|uniref:Uncharacterized protein n=1 Tax=Hymenobacter gummosus TaxID=1776032 RepID=A0A431U4A9_9BACT|nr:hypothetical protein [Hymenobacter gummosus]RTQ50255.1 hypothetical protein EJV47_11550 [Hymenobacter gummosus]
MNQPEGYAADPAIDQPPTAQPAQPARRGRGWGALALLSCLGLLLWCWHWLTSAQLSAAPGTAAETNQYTVALLLMPLAVGGLSMGLNRLWRGRWLLWLALFLLIAEAVLLIGAGGVLHYLDAETPTTTALLAGGMVGCLGLGYLVARWLRRE